MPSDLTVLNGATAVNALTIGNNYQILGNWDAAHKKCEVLQGSGTDNLVFTATGTDISCAGNFAKLGTNAFIINGATAASTDII